LIGRISATRSFCCGGGGGCPSRAREANPRAAAFFDGLAQFYRRGYLRWIDATKRSPEVRAQRIATLVELLEAGVKDHRKQ
jgi:uncharacterized protein YdeI (YjbR/CyaY-like superfamily)